MLDVCVQNTSQYCAVIGVYIYIYVIKKDE